MNEQALIEANRLQAKARIQQRENAATAVFSSTSAQNINGKRPLQVAAAQSTSPTAPSKRTNPSNVSTRIIGASSNLQNATALQRKSKPRPGVVPHEELETSNSAGDKPLKNMLGSYVEYDLAILKNSKGGFLMENEDTDPRRIKERELIEENKKKRIENQRKLALKSRQAGVTDLRCKHCNSAPIDDRLWGAFGVQVCPKCKDEKPELYSLLTKTECKEDYLLTDPELKDEELLPHLLRPNPHRPTYNNMMLFLRSQVEAYAFSDKKWGSPEALDAEFERRQSEKKDKKEKKFAKKLQELRNRTKGNVWHRRVEQKHEHEFVSTDVEGLQKCKECGMEIEGEIF